MKWHHLLAMVIAGSPLVMANAHAQQAAGGQGRGPNAGMQAVGDEYGHPDTIATGKSKLGPVYVDASGKTLYGPNQRALNQGGGVAKFCTPDCAKQWSPLAAPADAKPTGYWRVVDGAQGPQWAYKNVPVFTFNADKAPGEITGEGADEVWHVVLYIPPKPKITAPGNVAALFADGDYMLTDKQGHVLFASSKNGACGDACVAWTPFNAGLAAQTVGDWTVVRGGDYTQWAYHGKPVYVSEASQPPNVPLSPDVLPNGATVLHP